MLPVGSRKVSQRLLQSLRSIDHHAAPRCCCSFSTLEIANSSSSGGGTNSAHIHGASYRYHRRPQHESLQDVTHRLLDARATPLGSFRKATTNDILDAFHRLTSPSQNAPVRIHSATLAGRLLRRFTVEVSVNNLWANDISWAIAEMNEIMRQIWLRIDGRVAAENAEAALRGSVEEYFNGRTDLEPPVENFTTIAEKWLHLESDDDDINIESIERASGILLYLTECLEIEEEAQRKQISDLFRQVSDRLLTHPSAEYDKLLQRMDQLKSEGWDMIDVAASSPAPSSVSDVDLSTAVSTPSDPDVTETIISTATTSSTPAESSSESQSSASAVTPSSPSSSFIVESMKQQFATITSRADADSVDGVEAVFRRFETRSKENGSDFTIDESDYRNLLGYYIRAKPEHFVDKAQDVVNKLIDHMVGSNASIEKSVRVKVSNRIMQLLADSRKGMSGEDDLTQVSQGIIQIYEGIAEPNEESIKIFLSSQLKCREGMEKAMTEFLRMLEFNSSALGSDSATLYYALSTAIELKQESELMKASQLNGIHGNLLGQPFTRVIENLCRKGKGSEVQSLILEACEYGFQPDSSFSEMLLDMCVSDSFPPDSASTILRCLVKLYRKGVMDKAPDCESFAAVITSLFQVENYSEMRSLLFHVLDDLYRTNVVEYNEEEIAQLLNKMFKLWNFDASESLISKLENRYDKKEDGSPSIPLRASFYYYMMETTNNTKLVQRIFDRLLQRYRSSKDDMLRPDAKSFHKYICSLSGRVQKGANMDKVVEAVNLMIEMYEKDPNTSDKPLFEECFNSVILACIANENDKALDTAFEYVETMEKMGLDIEFAVRNILWTIAKQSDSARYRPKAEALFDLMTRSYRNGNGTGKPSTLIFSYLMDVILVDKSTEKLEAPTRLFGILREMEELKIKPSIYIYNNIMSACLRDGIPSEGAHAQACVEFIVDLIKKRQSKEQIEGNSVAHMISYGLLAQLIGRTFTRKQNMAQREKTIIAAFKCCCYDGMLSEVNLRLFRNQVSSRVLGLGNDAKPKTQWSRHVPRK